MSIGVKNLALVGNPATDFDAAVGTLRAEDVNFKTDVMASLSCHLVAITDPNGKDLMIYQHGTPSDLSDS